MCKKLEHVLSIVHFNLISINLEYFFSDPKIKFSLVSHFWRVLLQFVKTDVNAWWNKTFKCEHASDLKIQIYPVTMLNRLFVIRYENLPRVKHKWFLKKYCFKSRTFWLRLGRRQEIKNWDFFLICCFT